jgi:hypothetical protein
MFTITKSLKEEKLNTKVNTEKSQKINATTLQNKTASKSIIIIKIIPSIQLLFLAILNISEP